MRRSHPDPDVEAYLTKAERDLATAIRMSAEGPEFADVVCFMPSSAPKRRPKA